MPSTNFPWVKKPLLANAPMAMSAGPALAVAVSQAGGLGFIGPAMDASGTEQNLSTAAKAIRESESLSSLLPSGHPTLPVGVGFLLWKDELQTALSAVASHKPCAAWLYAPRNGQQELDEWMQGIRGASPETQVWIQIGTVAEARSIVESAHRPDVVVVQGAEAGGHGRAKDGMGLITLLPEVADVFMGHGIPLIAAGGIADGRGAAAAICLGTNGVVMGTRFLASTEARISKGYRDAVVQATEGAVNTTRTLLYNHLRGTYGWPEPFSPRTVTNRSWEDHVAGVSFDELKRLHDEAQAKGDAGWGPEGRLATYAGAGVGLVGEVLDAGEIVERVRDDAAQRVRRAQDVV
ncbi:nitronate monooxygenase [Aspergillus glaucus CBS 516.65]|uniref:Uncharacterized protein n=1 Tax=Aspergillus glaucus CBS 516.65 TaxID=1160497 RepID=A0A1L9VXW1_ASPGL|nr:hypothetical protein ASPGLDRAFT_117507 [Aspergillus glaucus CBS 516.65]OJJ88754.1 hypothetical protein ASPGLDRAFT_117507 [Aspergillus glaucus CBS 516.65]